MIYLYAVLTGLAAAALTTGLGYLVFAERIKRQESIRRRLAGLAGFELEPAAAARLFLRDQSLSSIPPLNRLLARLPNRRSLQLLLEQAGKPCNMGTLLLASAVLFGLGGLVGAGLGLGRMWFLGGVGLGLIPLVWLRTLRNRRLAAFREQFPEAVDLIGRALRAGHSLGSAVKTVAEELAEPVAGEFAKTFEDYSFGKSLEEALASLQERVGLPEVKFFVTSVGLQRETGGNLAEILDNISHVVRERFRLVRQVRALSAEGRLSGLILSLMTPALLVVLWVTNQGYAELLFYHPSGKKMLLAGAIFQALGMIVIKRLVTMKI